MRGELRKRWDFMYQVNEAKKRELSIQENVAKLYKEEKLPSLSVNESATTEATDKKEDVESEKPIVNIRPEKFTKIANCPLL